MKYFQKVDKTKANRFILALSAAVVLVVVLLLNKSQNISTDEVSSDIYIFPKINAVLNTLTFFSLLLGWIFIMKRKITAHKAMMGFAFACSSVFLVLYVIYHNMAPHTSFGGDGIIKVIYLFLLITHIFLAIFIVPLALITIFRALSLDLEKHKKIARWTLPIWLYVSGSGVLVYLMISQYYPV